MKWKILSAQQYNRLCNCQSVKKDIVPIAKCYMCEKDMDAEVALETTLEHLGANNQFFDLTKEEWTDTLYELNIWDECRRDVI